MTSPSKPSPPLDTANVTSLSGFSKKTEEQWKEELRESQDRKYRGIGATMKRGEVRGLYGIAKVFEGLTGKKADVDVATKLGEWFRDLAGAVAKQRVQIAELQANPTLTWISTQVEDMVTFPAAWMMDEVLGYTPAKTGTYSYEYENWEWVREPTRDDPNAGSMQNVWRSATAAQTVDGEKYTAGTYQKRMPTGSLVLCPLSVDRQALLFRMKFAGTGPAKQELGRDTLNACLFALDSNKDTLKLVWDSANIVTSLGPTLRAYNVPVLLDSRQLQPGQLLFVGVMQRNMELVDNWLGQPQTSTNDADWMRVAGIRQIGAANGGAGITPAGTSFLRGTCFQSKATYTAIPQQLSLANDLNVQSDWMPWFALQTKPLPRQNPLVDGTDWGGVTTG